MAIKLTIIFIYSLLCSYDSYSLVLVHFKICIFIKTNSSQDHRTTTYSPAPKICLLYLASGARFHRLRRCDDKGTRCMTQMYDFASWVADFHTRRERGCRHIAGHRHVCTDACVCTMRSAKQKRTGRGNFRRGTTKPRPLF